MVSRRYVEALRRYDEILDIDPRNDLGNRGKYIALYRLGKPEEAQALMAEFMDRFPEDVSVQASVGYLLQSSVPDLGLQAYERASKVLPRDAWVLAGRAGALAQLARFGDAEAVVREALEEQPNDTNSHRAAGDLALAQHQARAAVRHYSKALELDRTNTSARNGRRRAAALDLASGHQR